MPGNAGSYAMCYTHKKYFYITLTFPPNFHFLFPLSTSLFSYTPSSYKYHYPFLLLPYSSSPPLLFIHSTFPLRFRYPKSSTISSPSSFLFQLYSWKTGSAKRENIIYHLEFSKKLPDTGPLSTGLCTLPTLIQSAFTEIQQNPYLPEN
jgi:hypothetical protein